MWKNNKEVPCMTVVERLIDHKGCSLLFPSNKPVGSSTQVSKHPSPLQWGWEAEDGQLGAPASPFLREAERWAVERKGLSGPWWCFTSRRADHFKQRPFIGKTLDPKEDAGG